MIGVPAATTAEELDAGGEELPAAAQLVEKAVGPVHLEPQESPLLGIDRRCSRAVQQAQRKNRARRGRCGNQESRWMLLPDVALERMTNSSTRSLCAGPGKRSNMSRSLYASLRRHNRGYRGTLGSPLFFLCLAELLEKLRERQPLELILPARGRRQAVEPCLVLYPLLLCAGPDACESICRRVILADVPSDFPSLEM